MNRHEPFRYRSAEELLEKAEELGVELPCQDDLAPLFSSVNIFEAAVPNRLAVQPMEGCDGEPNGAPGELTLRRYRRYAQGGSGLIWAEACSVSAAGRSNPRQLLLSEDTLDAFKRLTEEVRTAASRGSGSCLQPFLVLQLTHSGRRSMQHDRSKPKAACFNPLFDAAPAEVDVVGDEELAAVRDKFVAAALLARRAGFDAVDIKACHGYLVHELLSAFTRTDSRYGGDFEGRSRFLLEILREIRATEPQLALAVRLSATDAVPHPYGFGVEPNGTGAPDLSEPLQLRRLLREAGCALLNITAGIPAYRPYVGRPFDRPVKGAPRPDQHPLEGVSALIRWAAAFQKADPRLPVVGTGYSWLRHFWPNVGAAVIAGDGASFIGLGRGSFAYPDAPLDLRDHGRLDPRKCCIACSRCTELMRSRQIAGCVIRDPSIYRPVYRNLQARSS